VWQVGGNKPILGDGTPTAVPTEERYNAANVGNLDTAKYVLSVAPHTPDPDPAKRRDADDKLSDITFTAGDKNLKGKLTLYNNGYFLTDLDVTNGTATWSEMMGGESSHLQAVFTPEGDSGARWISHQLAYEPGRAESVYSDDGNGQWPVKTPEERNTTLNTATYTPTSGDYTVRTVPSTQEGYRTIEVTFADPNFRGFIRGGFYAPNDYEYPKFDIETTVENGVARFTYREDSYFENSELIAKVLPHPDMNARASQVKLTGDYRRGGDYSASGTFTVEGTAGQAPADPGRGLAAFLEAVRVMGQDSSYMTLQDDQAFKSAAPYADARSHNAVLAFAYAIDKVHERKPEAVTRVLESMRLDAAQAIAGDALDFTHENPTTAPVQTLHATEQSLGLRPEPSNDQEPRIVWFAERGTRTETYNE